MMRIISKTECEEWLQTNFGNGFTRDMLARDYPHSVAYQLPVDTGRKTALARAISNLIDVQQPGLFWITDWEIFPSSSNIILFDGYRKSLGEERPVHAAPGHVFDHADLPQF